MGVPVDGGASDRGQGIEAEAMNRLSLSRGAAMNAANEAVRDATRLTRLLAVLNDSGDLAALLDRSLSTLSELFAAEIVVLLDPAGTGSYVPLASIGLPEDMAALPFRGDAESNVARTMGEGGPLLIREALSDPTLEPQFADLDVGTVIYLPVSASHAARGVLILARCGSEPFAFSDVGLLTAMAYRIGLAIEQAQRRAQLERIVRSERTIGLDLEELGVARRTVAEFPELVGADGALLALIDEAGHVLHRADDGDVPIGEEDVRRLVSQLVAAGALGRFEAVSSVFDPRLVDAVADETRGGHAFLALPIGRDRLEGVLLAFRSMPTPFDPDLHTIALLYAGQCSAALENARLYRAVHAELADRRRAERALKASEERLGALIRSVHDLIVVLGPTGEIRFANPAADRIWIPDAGQGRRDDFWRRIAPADVESLRAVVARLEVAPGTTSTAALGLVGPDGRRREFDVVLTNLLADPAVAGIVVTFHDVTDRKCYELRLEELAFRDPLTRLANRAHFQDRLRHALAPPRREPVAVIFFDLDDFKVVNDSLGHDAGDAILRAVADRMRLVLRHGDTGARLGGDEFTVLLETDVSMNAARRIAGRLLDSIRQPIRVGDRDVVVGSSFGIALGEPGRDSAEDLLRKADVAMYHAKAGGKNACAVFDECLEVAAFGRLEAETDLRRALALDELEVFYQPIVSLDDGRLLAAEALMRWRHPVRGLVGPMDFLAVAEATGLIVDLGGRVVELAFERLSRWRALHGIDLPLHVNLSPRQLAHESIVEFLRAAALRHGVDPTTIVLEITENMAVADRAAVLASVERLRAEGFRIAVDDFGTGFSSLSCLETLPVDLLKIDRSFVAALATNPRDAAIVRAIASLAEALGIDVVAEGIETPEQQALLLAMKCTRGQGFLFAPALSGDDFERLLPLRRSTEARGGSRSPTAPRSLRAPAPITPATVA